MTEKFTNIAGGSFLPYVAKEIEKRKSFLKESNIKRENKHLVYLNNRNSWFRLTSCVNVNEDHFLAKRYGKVGDELAKKYILQGGVVENVGGVIKNRAGIGLDGLYGTLEGQPLGLKPMPGIISIDLSSAGKLGTLQYATIKFICYDLEQLELMDALYMKLGFTLVLEWGHTIFLGDTSKLETPIPLNVFQHNTKESLIVSIQKKRLSHSANYDAMVGVISNFGWETQSDGSYICDVKLVGAGDILESLKINQAVDGNTKFTSTKDPNTDEGVTSKIADKDLSLLNNALFSINENVLKYSAKNNGTQIVGTQTESYRKLLNKIYTHGPYKFINFNDKGDINGDDISIRGNQYSLISELNKNHGENEVNIPKLERSLFSAIRVPYEINPSDDNTEPSVYITLGHLLALITATGMIYDKVEGVSKPHIYLDFNDSLNYCSTFKGQMSMDPRVCIIPRNQDNTEDLFGLGTFSDEIFNSINGVDVIRETNINNYQGSSTGYVSTSTQGGIIGQTNTGGFNNGYLNVSNDVKGVRARLMYIAVNINYITDILRQQRGTSNKGNVNLSDFLNTLLDGISKSLCGFNEFRLSIDDTNKCMRIIDDNKTQSKKELEDSLQYTEIPLFGNQSIVYKYSFKSKIGPNMASMITIAAQAHPESLGDDAFAISNLSRGLIDRVAVEKTTSKVVTETLGLNTQTQVTENNLDTLKIHMKQMLETFKIDASSIDPSINTYRELLSEYRTKQDSTNKASIIIPLDFDLEMDGLSGIIPNSAFIIPTNLLPSSYKTKEGLPKIAFIIHSISQLFAYNKWTTKITGQTINIRFDKEDEQVYTPILKSGKFGGADSPIDYSNPYAYPTCSRNAFKFFAQSYVKSPMALLKTAANNVGLNSKFAINSLISIAAGESGLIPQEEKHIYSESQLRETYTDMSESQYKRALRKGITKKEFFSIVYGEYRPSRVGNRNSTDGGKYYGRGYIQLTGYGNYQRYAKLSGIDILSKPELVNDPVIGAKICALYFKDKVKADQTDSSYFQKALTSVGHYVEGVTEKKIEYYNCLLIS